MNKKDYMEVKKWIKIAIKLKKKYKSYTELRDHCIKIFSKEYVCLEEIPTQNILIVKANHIVEGGTAGHLHCGNIPFYSIEKDGSFKRMEVNKTIDTLVEELSEHIDRKNLIRDVLQNQTPIQLNKLYERVVTIPKKTKKKASIKQRPGCQYLSIGGKPGKTKDLYSRD